MKKLIILLMVPTLMSLSSVGQTTKWVWPDLLAFNQTTGAPAIRATAKYAADRGTDSLGKLLRIEFKKADTALYNTLPKVTAEAMKIVTTLPDVIKGLESKISQANAPDTTLTKAIAAQQKTIEAQAKTIEEMALQISEFKAWADRQKLKEYIINFK